MKCDQLFRGSSTASHEGDRWPSVATARGYICASCRRIIAKDEYASWSLRFSGWCERCLGVLDRIR
jgi:hypothetical protein